MAGATSSGLLVCLHAQCRSTDAPLPFVQGTATRLAPALAVPGEGSSGGTFPHPFSGSLAQGCLRYGRCLRSPGILQPACSVAGETSGAPSQMSIPPPGYETPQASPPPPPPPAPQGGPLSHEDAQARVGSRQADDNVQYEFKSVQALRGRESSAKAKWQNQGWEFVSENRGTLRTELTFRRVKPKTFGAYLLSSAAAFRRLQPRTRLAVVASGALVLVASTTASLSGPRVAGTPSSRARRRPRLRPRHPPIRRSRTSPSTSWSTSSTQPAWAESSSEISSG